jgi:hypothetical protein
MSDDYYAKHRGICDKCCVCSIETEKIGQHCEHCKDGTIVYDPPWSERHEVLPEPMTCGRRALDQFAPGVPAHKGFDEKGQDRWEKHKSNGDRVCSFCGSLHPDDFWRLVKASAEAPEDAPYRDVVHIHLSDKGYKVYVDQPGVRNAMEGGIKFYKQHIPRDENGKMIVSEEQERLYQQAINRSHLRFDKYLAQLYPRNIVVN